MYRFCICCSCSECRGDALCRAISEPARRPPDLSHLWRGCEGVANAPFARPFGIPDGFIGAVLYVVIIALLLAPPARWGWIALLVLSGAATLANVLGVRDMMIFGGYCFYCLTTAFMSPVLLWSVWKLG
jgi:uncharacterized membrane protein